MKIAPFNKLSLTASIGLALVGVLNSVIPSQAATFNLTFDNTPDDNSVNPPITGMGTFSYDGDIQVGSFEFSELENLTVDFTLNGRQFNRLSEAFFNYDLLIEAVQDGYRAYLLNGVIAFSLPVDDAIDVVEFSWLNDNNDYYQQSGITYGNYLAQSPTPPPQPIPEPLTILGSATALGFGTFFKRKLKSSKSSEKETTNVG